MVVTYPADAAHRRRLREAAPGATLCYTDTEDEARAAIAEADVVMGNRFFLQSLPQARRLRWMQSTSTGVDILLASAEVRDRDFMITDVGGVFDDEVADHALALALALVRGIREAPEGWSRRPRPRVAELPALVFGIGGIGRAVARRLLAFGAPVTAVCRDLAGPGAEWARAHAIPCVGLNESPALLPSARLVFLCLPLTEETRGVFGPEALARLPDGAFIVNVARGGLIDEDALAPALDRLGGAGLDVFATEPLPPHHWMWSHPKVLVTPHVARSPGRGTPPWYPLFEENLSRWTSGRPLLNLVDRRRGY